MPPQHNTTIRNLLILTASILITFLPCIWNGFTAWDDNGYLTNNPFVKELSANNLIKSFTSLTSGSYMPLPLLSYALEFQIAQLKPLLYHLDNVILHAGAAILVYFLILRIDGGQGIALVTALLFALNPMRVESVAWISGRKDLLCAIFYVSALLMHVRMINSSQKKYFWGTLALFLGALFSKTQAASLPLALLVLDYFFNHKITKQDIVLKIPFFILSAVFAFIGLNGLSQTFPQMGVPAFSLADRLLLTNLAFSLHTILPLFPVNTSFFYPFPPKITSLFPLYVYAALAFNMLIIYSVGTIARRHRFVWLAGALFVITTISPLWSIWHEGYFISERDMYLSSVWLFYAIIRIISGINWKTISSYTPTLTVITALFFALLSFGKCFVWKNDLSLWGNVIDTFPDSPAGYIYRGKKFREYGMLELALKDLNRAIALKTNDTKTYYNRAMTYLDLSQFALAIADFDTILALDPKNIGARFYRAMCYKETKDYSRALQDLTILAANPDATNPMVMDEITEIKTLINTKS